MKRSFSWQQQQSTARKRPSQKFQKFREICDTPLSAGCGAISSTHGWMLRMGRRAKGDRHTIITSMPSDAAAIVRAEAIQLVCYIGDYIGWVVSDHYGLAGDVPLGEVADHPDPLPGPDGRAKYRAMIPRSAADRLIAEAELRGHSLSDAVAKVLCDRFGVPFEPRVKKKALKAWATAGHAGEAWSMTG